MITDNFVEIYVKSWSCKKAVPCSTVSYFPGRCSIILCRTLFILMTDSFVEIYVKSWSRNKAIPCSTVSLFRDIFKYCVSYFVDTVN